MSESPNILRQGLRQMGDELLGFFIPVLPGLLLFWLLPSWLIPLIFAFGGFVWALMWLGMRSHFDHNSGLQILAYILFMALLLVGIVPGLHDLLSLGEIRPVSIQYEEEVRGLPPLSVIRFENWEVDMDHFTQYGRRVYSQSTRSTTYVTTYMVPMVRKKDPTDEVYVVVIEGALPLPEKPKDYWSREGMVYGFIPNKLERFGMDRETLQKMEAKGVRVDSEAIFVELFDSPGGKRKQILQFLGIKLGFGGFVWLLIHLGVFIHRLWKKNHFPQIS